MRFIDTLKYCFFNLWRRKVRTILAILGVFIGIFSILATVSIGLALSYNLDSSLENLPGIRIITILPGKNNESGGNSSNISPLHKNSKIGKKEDGFVLNNETKKILESYDHVALVSPILEIRGYISLNNKHNYLRLIGLDKEIFPYFSDKFLAGDIYKDTVGSVILPSSLIFQIEGLFGEYDEINKKYIPPTLSDNLLKSYMNKKIQFTFEDLDRASEIAKGHITPSEDENTEHPPLNYEKFDLQTAGITDSNSSFSYGTSYTNFKTVISISEKMKKINPLTHPELKFLLDDYEKYKKNKEYSSFYLAVDKFENVKSVYENLKKSGYRAVSSIDMFESIKEIFTYVQLILGSLGAISLIVAMIGITNTTIMTIYERTREIGIMKVLGSSLKDIRNLFLFESGLIGLCGGLVGSIVALILSNVVNFMFKDSSFIQGQNMNGESASGLVSYIPLWLILLALVISTLVGLIAGYLPSKRAMKMSALESLKGE